MKKPEKPKPPKNPGRFNRQPPAKTNRIVVWKTPPQWEEYIDTNDSFDTLSEDKKREAFFNFVDCEYGVCESMDETYCGYTYDTLATYTYDEIESEFYSPSYCYTHKEWNLKEIVDRLLTVNLEDAFIHVTACNEWSDDDRTYIEIGFYEPNSNYDNEVKEYEKAKTAHNKAKKEHTKAYKKHREAFALYREEKRAYDEWRAKRIAELEAAGEL